MGTLWSAPLATIVRTTWIKEVSHEQGGTRRTLSVRECEEVQTVLCRFSPEQLAGNARLQRIFEGLCRGVARESADVGRTEFNSSLQVRLPTLFTRSIERAQAALDDDDAAFDDELSEIAETLDTSEERVELARALIALREVGKVPPKSAAAAVFETQQWSRIGLSTLLDRPVNRGMDRDARTPGGLIVAAA
jgi:hypothetical protein